MTPSEIPPICRVWDPLVTSRGIATISIPLTRGYTAFIDDVDADLAAFRWYAGPAGRTVYARRRFFSPDGRGKIKLLHRVVWAHAHPGEPMPAEIDHVDGNGLNNTRANLRAASRKENGRNRGPQRNNMSGFKGVHWNHRASKWQVDIKIDDKNQYLGLFVNILAAALTYDAAARESFGSFAYLNMPLQGERGVPI